MSTKSPLSIFFTSFAGTTGSDSPRMKGVASSASSTLPALSFSGGVSLRLSPPPLLFLQSSAASVPPLPFYRPPLPGEYLNSHQPQQQLKSPPFVENPCLLATMGTYPSLDHRQWPRLGPVLRTILLRPPPGLCRNPSLDAPPGPGSSKHTPKAPPGPLL